MPDPTSNPTPETPPTAPTPARPGGVLRALQRLIRTRITAGVITIIPIVVTVWLVRLVFGLIRSSSQWLVEAFLLSKYGRPFLESWNFDFEEWERIKEARAALGMDIEARIFIEQLPAHVQWTIPIVAVGLTIFVLYLIGLLTANLIGRRLINSAESLVERVPIIKTIYKGMKQILQSFSGDQTQKFQRVALIPFPQERMRCVGFITSIFRDSLTGEELATVFIATTPNPTTGYLQVLRRRELVELNWSVDEAIRVIISGGILRPEFLTLVTNEQRAQMAAEGKLPPDVPASPLAPPPEQ